MCQPSSRRGQTGTSSRRVVALWHNLLMVLRRQAVMASPAGIWHRLAGRWQQQQQHRQQQLMLLCRRWLVFHSSRLLRNTLLLLWRQTRLGSSRVGSRREMSREQCQHSLGCRVSQASRVRHQQQHQQQLRHQQQQ